MKRQDQNQRKFEIDLRDFVKQLLKARGFSYRHVANSLAISEATVKRMFSQGRLTLPHLKQIATLLDVTLAEIFKAAELGSGGEIYVLTQAEDDYFFRHEDDLALLVFLSRFTTLSELENYLGVKRVRFFSRLRRLEKLGFIEVMEKDRIRFLKPATLQFPNDGLIAKKNRRDIRESFYDSNFSGKGEFLGMIVMDLDADAAFEAEALVRRLNRDLQTLHNASELRNTKKINFGARMAIRPWSDPWTDRLKATLLAALEKSSSK